MTPQHIQLRRSERGTRMLVYAVAAVAAVAALAHPAAAGPPQLIATCPATGQWTTIDVSFMHYLEVNVITDRREPMRLVCYQAGSCAPVTVRVAPPRSLVHLTSGCIQRGRVQPINVIAIVQKHLGG